MIDRRALAVLAATLALGVFGALVARLWLARAALPATVVADVYPEPRALPPFALVTQAGTRFDRDALKGRWTLLTFGFANCPDACPTTLTQLALAAHELEGLDARRAPHVLWITVDPRRDTGERVGAYLAHFDRGFIGLTGAAGTIETLARALGAAAIAEPEVDGAYRVDHTAAVFLIDPEARLAAVFPAPHAARTLAADYRLIVARGG